MRWRDPHHAISRSMHATTAKRESHAFRRRQRGCWQSLSRISFISTLSSVILYCWKRSTGRVPSSGADGIAPLLVARKATVKSSERPKLQDCVVPGESVGRFYSSPMGKFSSALLQRGWQPAASPQEAQILWYQKKQNIPWQDLKCWQRPNHLRNEGAIGHKGRLLEFLRKSKQALRYVPESFLLGLREDQARFASAVLREPIASTPAWVLKEPSIDGGNGVSILFADEARNLLLGPEARVIAAYRNRLAQRYVKDLILLNGRKFDLRVYWLVASMQPPLVLYHDGTLRVSLERFDSANNSKGQHLTNAAQQVGGHDPAKSSEASRQPMAVLWALLDNLRRSEPEWPDNPRAHVECVIRDAIAQIWKVYAPLFRTELDRAHRERDAFVLFGADFMIDRRLNVYLSEIQSGPGLPVNTKAVRDIMTTMIPDLAKITLHMHQTPGASRWPLPLTNFSVIVNDSTVLPSGWC